MKAVICKNRYSVILLCTAACLAFVWVFLSLIGTYDGNHLFGLVLLMLCLLPLVNRDVLESVKVFTFLFGMAMGLRGIMILHQDSYWISHCSRDSGHYQYIMSYVFLYSIIALFMMYVGYYSKLGDVFARRLPRFRFLSGQRVHLMAVMFLAFVVGAVSLYMFYRNIGGVKILGVPDVVIREGLEQGGRLYYSLFLDFALLGFIFLYVYTMHRRRRLVEKIFLLAFISLVVLKFLIIGMKGIIIEVAVILVVIHHYLKKALTIKKALLLLVVILMAISLLHNYKVYGMGSADRIWSKFNAFDIGHIAFLTLGRSAGADMFFQFLDKTPSVYPFQYGKTFIRLLTSFVPRPFWPGKPWSFGREFSDNYLGIPGSKAVFSPTAIGELYVNFHIAGVMLGFFLIGVFLKVIYHYCIKSGVTKEKVIIYAVILAKMHMLVDGPFDGFTTFVLIRLFPIVIMGVLLKFLDNGRLLMAGSRCEN